MIADVPETLFVGQSDLIIDGDGHEITPGSSTGVGVDINGKNGITVRNLTITGFQIGIWLQNSNPGPAEPEENFLEDNTITNATTEGIKLSSANSTTLSGNNISNCFWGIHLLNSGNTDIWNDPPYSTIYDYSNTITNNAITGNAGGIWLEASNYNTLELNNVTGQSSAGIYLSVQSSNNTITGNTTSSNQYGIKLLDSSNNILTNNTVSNNILYGIWLDPSINNQINNNNFITNATQAYVADDSVDNNIDCNYWSDRGDSGSYVILSTPSEIEVKDNSPYARQDGWLLPDTTPPAITCPGDITIEAMEPEGVPIDDDRIQTFLGGVSATDNCDPPENIVITNDAPSMFPLGDTIVTFTATDTSDNSSTCQSTVTVAEAVESSLRIIPRIINREGRLQPI